MKDWEILKAISEGKQVQFKNYADRWADFDGLIGNYNLANLRSGVWRIKPVEPKVIYVNEYPEQGVCNGYFKKSMAESCAISQATRVAVKYIEVQE